MVAHVVNTMNAFLLTCLCVVTSSALRIAVQPSTYTEETRGPVNISCLPDATDLAAKDIFLLKIQRNNEDPIVVYRVTSGLTYGPDTFRPSEMHAAGLVDKDVSKTFLTLSLSNPGANDTGTYTCSMYFSGESGLFQERRARGNFTMERDMDVHAVMKTLQDKMTQLETKLKDQTIKGSKLQEKLEILQNEIGNQSKKISDLDQTDISVHARLTMIDSDNSNQSRVIAGLVERANDRVAFSAGLDDDITPSDGDVIVYPNVLMTQGSGYNPNTGVFTAPRAGLYGFHLLAGNRCGQCYTELCIRVNDDDLACLIAASEKLWNDHASISSVTDLEKGDQVKVVVEGTRTPKLGGWKELNQFTGYLIRAY